VLTQTQRDKAIHFRNLHRGPRVLVLPNAWDAASARIFEHAGFPAIATTSAGLANSLGYPDGEHANFHEVLEVVKHITRVVSVPLSVDMEAGYGDTLAEIVGNVKLMLDGGAIGLNLEDGGGQGKSALTDIEIQVDRIKTLREAGKAAASLL